VEAELRVPRPSRSLGLTLAIITGPPKPRKRNVQNFAVSLGARLPAYSVFRIHYLDVRPGLWIRFFCLAARPDGQVEPSHSQQLIPTSTPCQVEKWVLYCLFEGPRMPRRPRMRPGLKRHSAVRGRPVIRRLPPRHPRHSSPSPPPGGHCPRC